jgi:lactate racemase
VSRWTRSVASSGTAGPHFMAGWSGGRKVVAPGVAHHETIRTFHSARFMEDPLAVQCNLVGNPLHEEQLEIVRGLGALYGLNTIIDDDRDLAYVNFGEIVAGHAAAVEFVDGAIRVPARRKFKTVVTSSAGIRWTRPPIKRSRGWLLRWIFSSLAEL